MVRTCGILFPKKSIPIFYLIFDAFWCFLVRAPCFFVPRNPYFPHSPELYMVKSVVGYEIVSNTSHLERAECSDGGEFLCDHDSIKERMFQEGQG